MRLAHWRTPDVRFAEQGGSTIELRLYLPRRAWQFTFTRKRTAAVDFGGIVQTDDYRNQIATPSDL
jgi:hypothetical protein